MKPALQKLFLAVVAFFVYSASFAQGAPVVSSTLNNKSDLKTGQQITFSVTATQGNAPAATRAKGRIVFTSLNFAAKREYVTLEYLNEAVNPNAWVPLTISEQGVAAYGPQEGFALPNTTQFRLTAAAASVYTYRLEIVPAAGGEPLATANESVSIAAVAEATVSSTLSIVATEAPLRTNEDREFVVYTTANDRVGDIVNLRLRLTTPAQRQNITLAYAEIVTGDETEVQPLAFDEQGVGLIGPEGGTPFEDGEIYFRIRFSAAGTYALTFDILREDGTVLGTVSESVAVTQNVTGVKDVIQGTKVGVYPTLADGFVRVDLGNIVNAQVAVVDMLGRTVAALENVSQSARINTANFSKGTYFVRVVKGKETAISRFVVR